MGKVLKKMDKVLEAIFPKMIIQMANKHKKIVIMEMHIKATRGGHFTSTRMAIIRQIMIVLG